ncbi:MAG: hypothetical protein AVDCRST_MAG78-550, partial [uncultured Rubrobacteraceae bacterium]
VRSHHDPGGQRDPRGHTPDVLWTNVALADRQQAPETL